MKRILLLAMAGIFALSCNTNNLTDALPAPGPYETGILILNQGTTTGTLDYVQTDSMIIKDNVFQKANQTDLGVGLQSGVTYGNDAYLIDAKENKVLRINRNTLKIENQRQDPVGGEMVSPRYMTVLNGVGYITVWGDLTSAPKVLAVDPTTLQTIATIPVSTAPEKLFSFNHQIYVLLKGGKTLNDQGNRIAIIDPKTNTIKNEITVGYNPNGFITQNGNILISCGGHQTNGKNDENGSVWTLTPAGKSSETYNWKNSALVGPSRIQDINTTYDGSIYLLANGILYRSPSNGNLLDSTPVATTVYQSLWAFANTIVALNTTDRHADFYNGNTSPISLATGVNPIGILQ